MKKFMLLVAVLFFLLPCVADALEATWDPADPSDNVTSLTLFWQRGDLTGDVYNVPDSDGIAPLALDESWFEPGVEYHFWATFYNAVGPSENSNIATYTRPLSPGPPPANLPTVVHIVPGAPTTVIINP